MGQTIRMETVDGAFEGYLALPPSGRGAGLVLLPEIYNANAWVREAADRYAAAGYVVLAPDIYWRQGARQYQDYTPAGLARGRELGAVLEADIDRAITDIGHSIDALRRRSDCNGRVGVVGYCLGGKLAFLAATRLSVDASVMYYPVRLPPYLAETERLKAPAIMHFGDRDEHVPETMREAIARSVAGMPNIALHVYPGAGHGFARFGQSTCEPRSEALAHARSLELLRRLG